MLDNRNLKLALRLFLGVVFLYASLHKIAYPPGFAKEIVAYRLLPSAIVNLMAIYLPWLELFTGIALLAGVWTRTAARVVAALLVVFLVAIASRFARGEWDFKCGCFDESPSFLDPIPGVGHAYRFFFSSPEALVTFARDLILLAMAVVVARGARPGASAETATPPRTTPRPELT